MKTPLQINDFDYATSISLATNKNCQTTKYLERKEFDLLSPGFCTIDGPPESP